MMSNLTARPAMCLFLVLVAGGSASAAVTTGSLLAEMTDLDRLAVLPDPAYTTRQFSSYNRASQTPDDPENWFANGDRGHYLRVEEHDGRQEHVMMDAAGPGAIVRIWSADPKGILRIYIDGAEKPVIEADMKALLGGEVAGLPVPLAGERSRGYNLYFPIPYARHCKVTADQGKTFYHINYRTYAPGTQVTSFRSDDLERLADRIAAVARQLANPGQQEVSGTVKPFSVRAAPGQGVTLLELDGPAAIAELAVALSAGDRDAAARQTLLTITFDGHEAVHAPLGDFFGTAPGLNAFESLPLSVRPDAGDAQMISRWLMPFRQRAVLRIRNLGSQPVEVRGRVVTRERAWDAASLLFHAKWRIQRDMPVKPYADWTHLSCTGQGRFAGGALNIMNPVRNWWGEGDEKIYVDGETFPSHFGTGSEDYYGYAWCSPALFTHAYHNQPRVDGPGNRGHTSNNRFHILDDIPFTRSFRFDMEMLHHRGFRGTPDVQTTRAAVSYWYARPGGSDFFEPIRPADVEPVVVPPESQAAAPPPASQPADAITLSWEDHILTLHSPRLPGGKLQVWYLEAFCRRGSTHRAWEETTIPFETRLIAAGPRGRRLRLLTSVEGGVEIRHDIRSSADEVSFDLEIENRGTRAVDIDWAQPCIRVGDFTGRGQDDYFEKCFIFTDRGLTRMHETHRAARARYTPGQVYVPEGIDPDDVNPRPVSRTRPINGLVGCFSADDRMILATAWSRTQELFQGIITCIHSDFRIGGLAPGEMKRLHGRIYLLPNDPQALLERYRRDFGAQLAAGAW